MLGNIRLGWKGLTLAYYGKELNKDVKSFIVQAQRDKIAVINMFIMRDGERESKRG
jgi:hypothetical protein